MSTSPLVEIQDRGAESVLKLRGDFNVRSIAAVDSVLRGMELQRPALGFVVDVSELGAMDSAGALVIDRTLRAGICHGPFPPIRIEGRHPTALKLLEVARAASPECPPPPPARAGLREAVETIGQTVAHFLDEAAQNLSYLGQLVVAAASFVAWPWRARWLSIFHHMEEAGLKALPIIMFLSFFIGMVLAYLGAIQLEVFGATVYVVELVGISVMREFGAAIAAIVLAGRSASAFAAEIGAMRMQEEVDALRVMGLRPVSVLAAPRLIALVLIAPVLTLGANLAGILGGMLVSWLRLGISPALFISRTAEIVPMENLWIGLLKAPIFAFLIALAGTRQGLLVEGDVASLGRRTTAAVVQALFLIIFCDAVLAILFQEMGW